MPGGFLICRQPSPSFQGQSTSLHIRALGSHKHNWDFFPIQNLWSSIIFSSLSPSLTKAASKPIFTKSGCREGEQQLMLHFHLSSLGLVVAKKREEMSPPALLPILSPVSVNMLHLPLLLPWTFGCPWIFFRRARRAQPVQWLSQLQKIPSFLPSKRGGRMLTMTKEHSEVSQPFCRSLNDLPLSQSLKKNKRTVLAKLCMHINVSSVSK